MNVSFRQDTRRGQLTTVLGSDVLVLLRFSGSDFVNSLFEYRIEALSTERDIKLDALLGTHATVAIATPSGNCIHDGIVAEAEWAGIGETGHRYNLTLRPWIWLAGLRRNQRIFHNMTVVQILTELFAPYAGLGVPSWANRLTRDYPVLEYTVQYRESDLTFATRLMERFGISHHVVHAIGSHTLVLTDVVESHDKIGMRPFKPYDAHHMSDSEHFRTWHQARNVTTGAVRLTEWNFKTPPAAMEVSRIGDATSQQGQIESFDWPGDYLMQDKGKGVVSLRVMQERGQDQRIHATGDVASLSAGQRVTLGGDDVPGATGADFLCLVATHSYSSEGYGSGTRGDSEAFSGQYVLMPVTAALAPRRKTPLPVVQGPQTAVVVGQGQIDCDEYGRILVHFHWDLAKAYSMRCRVSQNWSGNGWGGMVIPRIGMEVVVEFLEGDPDKPLVTGCVYNGKNKVPYKLPQHKTRSTFKTDTHQGTGYNELRFEDENGKEEIFIHGQKDRNTKIENNQSERVNVNKVESVGHDKASEIENNLLQVVDGNMELRVGPGNRNSVTPAGAKDYPEGLPTIPLRFGPVGSGIGTGDLMISVEQNKLQTVGANHDEAVKGNKTSDVKKNYDLKVGKEIVIDAGDRITLNCGQTRIVMEDNGTITVNAKKIQVTADQLITLLADLVKIN
jgi:type VI secretion system secreted protein VgrG